MEWDIVQRLREGRTNGSNLLWSVTATHREAADEINRLRAENERLREALFAIVCNTEPSAIKHRDYDHLAQSIYACARAALGEKE